MLGSFKRFIQAWALVWAWQWPRARREWLTPASSQSRELNSRREHREVRLRQEKKLPPRLRCLPQRGGYHGSQARDRRFSNQRSLRRMYYNC